MLALIAVSFRDAIIGSNLSDWLVIAGAAVEIGTYIVNKPRPILSLKWRHNERDAI